MGRHRVRAVLAIAVAGACSTKEASVDKKDPLPPAPTYLNHPPPTAASPSPTAASPPATAASPSATAASPSPAAASPSATAAQLARKQASIAAVKAMGLPWIEHLPVVEDESAITPRTTDEVAARCVATVLCALKGESSDQKLVDLLVDKLAAKSFFSPREQAFLRDRRPPRQDLVNFAWGYECVHVFLWALGYLPQLNPPDQIADVAKEVVIIRDKGRDGFAKDAKLRPLREVLDQADLYYRLHWAVIELRLKANKPAHADEGIIRERHRALNWLIQHMGQAWDDVTTDT
jgi:hypothetical protein